MYPNLYDNLAIDSTERKVQNDLLNLWTNFAKFGYGNCTNSPEMINVKTHIFAFLERQHQMDLLWMLCHSVLLMVGWQTSVIKE